MNIRLLGDSPQDPGVKTGALYLMKKDIAIIIAPSHNNLAQAQALQKGTSDASSGWK